jgi:hypothetical protein
VTFVHHVKQSKETAGIRYRTKSGSLKSKEKIIKYLVKNPSLQS